MKDSINGEKQETWERRESITHRNKLDKKGGLRNRQSGAFTKRKKDHERRLGGVSVELRVSVGK